jgi:hypothetical protein
LGIIRCSAVFPKVDALRARVDGAAGLLALGAKGSVRDRLTPLYRLNFREADTSGRRDLNDERGNETGGLPGD